ncbi:MAG: hydroxyacid dehydrogenase [Candidatus Poseidoniaceae archaeon]|nr:hydroxyacid dehydrogenase [Candidatus Poseidoniaceae archaeon]
MGRIAVTDGMDDSAVKQLEDAGHEVVLKHYSKEELEAGILSDFDAVVIRSATKITDKVIRSSSGRKRSLKLIGRAGVGVDNINMDAATKSKIAVCNTPSSSTNAVVELTIGHLLSCTRHITTGDRTLRNGKWEKKNLRGSELSGKRLGLIGFGRIAQGVGRLARSIGMTLHAYDPYLPAEIAADQHCTLHDNIDDVFRLCTHISIHCNHSAETHHLVNSERISMMPGIGIDGVECGNHLVNCARGGIVDEVAVLNALESGALSSVALDVFEVEPVVDNPLLNHRNFHGTPHIGAATYEAQARIGQEMAALIIDFLKGRKPKSILNPEVI